MAKVINTLTHKDGRTITAADLGNGRAAVLSSSRDGSALCEVDLDTAIKHLATLAEAPGWS
ncbi:hypothetical protein [Sorangium sp. So ce1024]|uniref:hypothetical protein n=1 Tax=Sorangium sp. So ce1024 TaxID=3133327 RepID=UPI003F032889